MEKIKMLNPIVEMDGDEMTRILWKMIKDEIILPFVELKTEYYDLGLAHRDETDDKVTVEAAEAIKRLHVGVKCATITPNSARMEEYRLKKMWKSPNATIRSALDGTVFRSPITVSCIKPYVRTWDKPITIARHAFGDVYKATDWVIDGAGRAELLFTAPDGSTKRETICDFEDGGVLQGMFNKDRSIRSFARACFGYAVSSRQDLWFSAKDTISKQYDGRFRDIFAEVFENEYKAEFERLGLNYLYNLIDDAVARAFRSSGGFIWACKNYDGDVMSDMISTAFGSLALMTSVLVSPDGNFEYEAAHGTITRHYRRYLNGEKPSSNPVATIFAWSGALRKRGELDGTPELSDFAGRLEKACVDTIESGVMTGDLLALSDIRAEAVSSEDYIKAVRARLG